MPKRRRPFVPKFDPVDVRVGSFVRRKRRRLRMNLDEMAGMIGVSSQQLAKYETGYHPIPVGVLWALSRMLSVPVESFFAGTPAPKSSGLVSPYEVKPRKLARYVSRIRPAARRKLLRLVRELSH